MDVTVVLVASCTAGQVPGKCAVYGVARWAPHRLPARAIRVIDRVEPFRERGRLIGPPARPHATASF